MILILIALLGIFSIVALVLLVIQQTRRRRQNSDGPVGDLGKLNEHLDYLRSQRRDYIELIGRLEVNLMNLKRLKAEYTYLSRLVTDRQAEELNISTDEAKIARSRSRGPAGGPGDSIEELRRKIRSAKKKIEGIDKEIEGTLRLIARKQVR